jgi:hypothetical protein
LAQVHVSHANVDYVLELTNVSRSGALVHLGGLEKPLWIEKGRIVELCIIIPVDRDTVEVRGRIVRLDQRGDRWGFAVEYLPLSKAAQSAVDRLIALGRPQPPPLPKFATPPPLPEPNRRQHERFELLAAVHGPSEDEDLVLELTNISRSGALVHLGSLDKPTWLATGETLDLSIIDPESLAAIPVRGTVVRLEQRGRRWGFGIQFHPLEPNAAQGVTRLCALGRPQA